MGTNIEASDLLENCRLNWKIYVFGLVTGAIVGLGLYKGIPPQFEGVMNVQVGKLAGQQVEDRSLTIAVIHTPEYIEAVLSESGDIRLTKLAEKIGLELHEGRSKGYRVTPSKSGHYIHIRLRAGSTEVVELALSLIKTSLINRHEKMFREEVQIRGLDLAERESSLSEKEHAVELALSLIKTSLINRHEKMFREEVQIRGLDLAEHESSLSEKKHALESSSSLLEKLESDASYLGAILLKNELIGLSQSLPGLRDQKLMKKVGLTIRNSHPTRLIGKSVSINPKPVFPNLFLLIVLGSTVGFILAIFFVRKRIEKPEC